MIRREDFDPAQFEFDDAGIPHLRIDSRSCYETPPFPEWCEGWCRPFWEMVSTEIDGCHFEIMTIFNSLPGPEVQATVFRPYRDGFVSGFHNIHRETVPFGDDDGKRRIVADFRQRAPEMVRQALSTQQENA